jgi:hypothetical protein
VNRWLILFLTSVVSIAACTSDGDPRTPGPPPDGMALHTPSEDVERAVARFASGGRVEIAGGLTVGGEQAVLFAVEASGSVGWGSSTSTVDQP